MLWQKNIQVIFFVQKDKLVLQSSRVSNVCQYIYIYMCVTLAV